MLRALRFLLLAAALLVLAWWIGGLPGDMVAHSGPYTIETSVPAAILLLVITAWLATLVLRLLGRLRAAPGSLGAWRGGRRQQAGELATQRGMVALAAGDATAAQAHAAKARKLLGDTPLAMLLTAQVAQLKGDAAAAAAAFKQLAAHKEFAFLGHHGLSKVSTASGDYEAARDHILAAQAAYPGSAWAKTQRLELAVRTQDWKTALGLATQPAQVAALATAAAQASQDGPTRLQFARTAAKAAPGLAPAVVTLAEALREAGKPRAAKRALLDGWKAAPNPMIAAAFLAPVSAKLDQARAAAELAAANPGHPESEVLLAETSLAAELPGEAKRHAEAALGKTGGRAEAVLAKLSGQPAPSLNPSRWQCSACHNAQDDWSAACARCGEAGTLRWGAPGTALAKLS